MLIRYRNITLEEMLNMLIQHIINKKEIPTFYYRREYDEFKEDFIEINEIDLLDSRFRTIDDDFSEYDWELEKSNIYIREEWKDMLEIISGLILIIFGLIIVYLFSDEHLDRVEDKMIKNILKERIERSN